MTEEPHIAPPTLPSSDLIIYRFDQTDKKIEDLDHKFDSMGILYASKEELAAVNKRLDDYKWYWRTVFTALLLCVGGIIAALVHRG